ncbi:MAG TPA: hypothetical protein VIT65_22290 [Microlunatus sp.]
MRPEEAAAAIAAETAHLKAVPTEAQQLLEAEARAAAASVRVHATRSGDSLSVRVVAKPSGVRITVQGPRAVAYRSMIERQLNSRVPQLKAEIRVRTTTRRSR